MIVSPWYIGSDMTLFAKGVLDKNKNPVNDGTVTYVVQSKYPINDVTVVYDSGTLDNVSDGRYEKTLDTIVTSLIAEGQRVLIFITFHNVEGSDKVWRMEAYGTYA